MRRLTLILPLLAISGCAEDTKRQLSECEMQAMRAFPEETWGGDKLDDYTILCMRAAGYEYLSSRCGRAGAIGADCYRSTGTIDRALEGLARTHWPS